MKTSSVFRMSLTLAMLFFSLACMQAIPQKQVFAAQHRSNQENLVDYANPLAGTGNQGYTFPGADMPFGMVQWSPDTTTNPPVPSGYKYKDTQIRGFSLTHLSGAGCPTFGDFPFIPFVGTVNSSPTKNPSSYYSTFSHSSETASPGNYSVQLTTPGYNTPDVTTQLTVTPRTGFGQFTYPASTLSTMLINAGGSLSSDMSSSIQINTSTSQISGSAVSGNFCAEGNSYTIYFVAQFNVPFTDYGTWKGGTVTDLSTSAQGTKTGAYITFDTTQTNPILIKVGVSYVSTQNALANLQAENPGWDFSAVSATASTAWNTIFNEIQVSGGTTADMQAFYTSMYHAFLFPSLFSDDNGQYIGFDNQMYTVQSPQIAQYANYSEWDIYRTQIPLLAMLNPGIAADMAQSLVNDYQQWGCLPRWPIANANAKVMNGDSSDPIIAEAYAFGATNFDTATALKAVLNGAMQTCTIGNYTERPYLSDYLSLGYVPYQQNGMTGQTSASDTLEYSIDDFAISQFALALGDTTDYTTFSARAQSWQNLYNPTTGYIEPRNADGTFISNYSERSGIGFKEGDAYQYSWMIPYNLAALFTDMGGNQQVASRLNTFFKKLNTGPQSPHAWLGNEPSLASPWAYDFAGEPWQTQAVVRTAITSLYNATPKGLPGNDDLGTMSSWYIWSAIGLYPEYAGVADLVIGSPLFPQITLNLGNGSQLQILATGASDTAPYVQSLTVNGQSSNQLWEPLSTLSAGTTLQFTLGSTPNMSWGSDPADAPPSFGAV